MVFIGASLEFATSVFRTILSEQGIDQLGKMLVNADMDSKLIELFPPNKREEDCLVRHFEAQDMKELVEFHQKNVMDSIKKDLLAKLHGMMTDEDANAKEVCFNDIYVTIHVLTLCIIGHRWNQASHEGQQDQWTWNDPNYLDGCY